MTLGFVHFNSWAGFHKVPCEILKETPQRFKVRLLEDVTRRRRAGDVVYAPKYAVVVDKPAAAPDFCGRADA